MRPGSTECVDRVSSLLILRNGRALAQPLLLPIGKLEPATCWRSPSSSRRYPEGGQRQHRCSKREGRAQGLLAAPSASPSTAPLAAGRAFRGLATGPSPRLLLRSFHQPTSPARAAAPSALRASACLFALSTIGRAPSPSSSLAAAASSKARGVSTAVNTAAAGGDREADGRRQRRFHSRSRRHRRGRLAESDGANAPSARAGHAHTRKADAAAPVKPARRSRGRAAALPASNTRKGALDSSLDVSVSATAAPLGKAVSNSPPARGPSGPAQRPPRSARAAAPPAPDPYDGSASAAGKEGSVRAARGGRQQQTMPRLLHVHATIRRNYRSLQRSHRVYVAMCDTCLASLEHAQLLPRLSQGAVEEAGRTQPQESVWLTVRAAGPTVRQLHQPDRDALAGAEPCADGDAAAASAPSFTVRVAKEWVRWVNRPVRIPELPTDVLFGLTSAADAAEGEQAEEKSDPVDGGPAHVSSAFHRSVEQWQQHWRADGVTQRFVDILEEALTNSAPPGPPQRDPEPPRRRPRAAVGSRETESDTLSMSAEVLGLVLPLLQTIELFRWAGDERDMAAGELARETDEAPAGVQGIPHCLAALRAELVELRSLGGQSGSGAELLAQMKRRLTLTQAVLRSAQNILRRIPKVEECCCAVAPLVPAALPGVLDDTTPADSAPLREEASYTADILPLLMNLLLRYVLAGWPILLSSAHRGGVFELLSQPRFTSDLAPSAAAWYAFWETCQLQREGQPWELRPLSTAVSTAPRRGHKASSPHSNDEARSHADCPRTGGATAAAEVSLYFAQRMHALCWPTVLDRRSAIVQRALGLSPSPTADAGTPARTTEEPTASAAAAPPACPPQGNLRDIAAVLSSSEKRQRLALELLYVHCFALRDAQAASVVMAASSSDSVTPASATPAHLPPAARRAACALSVLAADVDRFVCARYFPKYHQPGRWLLLPSPAPADETTPTCFADRLRQEVSWQSAEPYMLTRQVLETLAGPLESELADMPASHAALLGAAIVRAVGGPCVSALTQLRGARADGEHTWAHLVRPLLRVFDGEAQQRFAWRHVLRELKSFNAPARPRPDTAGRDDVAAPADVREAGGPQQAEELLRLGHLAAFLLTAQSLQRRGRAEEGEERDRTPSKDAAAATSFQHSVRARFERAVMSCLGDPATATVRTESRERVSSAVDTARALLRHWPCSASADRAVAERLACAVGDTGAALQCCASLQRCAALLSSSVFTPELEGRVRDWLDKQHTLEQRDDALMHGGESVPAVLRCWHGDQQAVELGLPARSLTLEGLYAGLWRVTQDQVAATVTCIRTAAPGVRTGPENAAEDADAPTDSRTGGEALLQSILGYWETAAATAPSAGSPPADSAPSALLSPTAVRIVLRTMRTVFLRGGLTTIAAARPPPAGASAAVGPIRLPVLESVRAAVAGREERGGSTPGTAASTPELHGSASVDATPAAAADIAAVASTLHRRLLLVERLLLTSTRAAVTRLPLTARLDAVFLGCLPLDAVVRSVECGSTAASAVSLSSATTRDWRTELRTELTHARGKEKTVAELLVVKHASLLPLEACARAWAGELPSPRPASETALPAEQFMSDLLDAVVHAEAVEMQQTQQQQQQQRCTERKLNSIDGAPRMSESDAGCVDGAQQFEKTGSRDTEGSPGAGDGAVRTADTHVDAASITMEDHAGQLAGIHALVAYLWLRFSPDGGQPPADDAAGIVADDQTLFAMLLHRIAAALPAVESRGHAEELLLWLASAVCVMQARWASTLERVGQLDAADSPPPPWVAVGGDNGSGRGQHAAVEGGAAEAAAHRPACDILTAARFTLSPTGSLLAHSAAAPAAGDDTLRLATARAWARYVVERLSPMVLASLTSARVAGGGGGSGARAIKGARDTSYAAVATRALAEAGAAAPASLWAVLGTLLQRWLQDRHALVRQHGVLLPALAALAPTLSAPMAEHGVLPAAAFLRDGAALLSPAEVGAALRTVSVVVDAATSAALPGFEGAADGETLDRRPGALPGRAGSRHHRCPHDASRSPAPLPLVAHQTTPMYPVNRVPAAPLRAAWASLVKDTLWHAGSSDAQPADEHTNGATATAGEEAEPSARAGCGALPPPGVLIDGLVCGARVRCRDTRLYEQLLACVVYATDAATSPTVPALSMRQWAAVLQSCGDAPQLSHGGSSSSSEGGGGASRREAAALLRGPLLDQVSRWCAHAAAHLFTRSTQATMPVDGPMHGAPPPRLVVAHAQELCLLLEALPAVYVESSGFWRRIRQLVDAWTHSVRATEGLQTGEAEFWAEEWRRSYNWAVLSAGHPSSQLLPNPPSD